MSASPEGVLELYLDKAELCDALLAIIAEERQVSLTGVLSGKKDLFDEIKQALHAVGANDAFDRIEQRITMIHERTKTGQA